MDGVELEEDAAMHRLMTPCVCRVGGRFLLMIHNADAWATMTLIVPMQMLTDADTN